MFMKTFTFFVSFLFAIAVLQAQDYQISFTGSGQSTTIDSIQIENLTQGTILSLNGDDVLNLVGALGIKTPTGNENMIKIYPNPMITSTTVEFFHSNTQTVWLEIFNEIGMLIAKQRTRVQQGSQRFEISGLNAGIYTVNVRAVDWKYTTKLISLGNNSGNIAIKRQSTDKGSSSENALKSTKDIVQMQYNDGEMLLFKGFAGNYARVLTLLPTQSQTVNFEFIPCSDQDGNNYAVVTIGVQIWMAENLKVTNYPDGTPILLVTDSDAWGNLSDNNTDDAYCYFNNNSGGEAGTFGALYTWAAAMGDNAVSSNGNPSGVQGICPSGWHLPSDAEWTQLTDYLGGESIAGGKLKATNNWFSPNIGATNETGFTAISGGCRSSSNGSFIEFEYGGYWWGSTEELSTSVWRRRLYYNDTTVNRVDGNKSGGYCIRCVLD